jgi:hypothetical protein
MQAIVVSLCVSLPKQTYHVFVDNLFLTPPLLCKLYDYRYRAIGIACPNCGIPKDLKRIRHLIK